MTSTEHIAAGVPLHIANSTLVPIEKTTIRHNPDLERGWFYASKELVAIVVRSPSGIQTFDVSSGTVSIDDLVKKLLR